jgi:predicted Zn-dependent peptidase
LVAASLILRAGAADEPEDLGGGVVLAARALTEGTARFDAVALAEAAERLGAVLTADAGWHALSVGLEVPGERLGPGLELMAEVAGQPAFPAGDVERLREERLNEILQGRADPRRRADEAFAAAIYDRGAAYRRPAGGLPETVEGLDAPRVATLYRTLAGSAPWALVVGGDVEPEAVADLAARSFAGWPPVAPVAGPLPSAAIPPDRPSSLGRHVRVIHRPGSVQSEIRIGHVGVSRRDPDFYPLLVLSMILGGLFDSRLNRRLREERGYTYGAGAGFDARRAAGPFVARAAVHTAVTVPAIVETLAEIERIRHQPVSNDELRAAREFLVGTFPIRFETPGPLVAAVGGLFVHGLPEDELQRYRERVEAVTADEVARVARERIDPDRLAIVVVGDADAFQKELEGAGLGPMVVEGEAPVGRPPTFVTPETGGPVPGTG